MKYPEIKLIFSLDEIKSSKLSGLEEYLTSIRKSIVESPLFQFQLTVKDESLAIHIQANRVDTDAWVLVSALAMVGVVYSNNCFYIDGYAPIYQASNVPELDLMDVTFPLDFLVEGRVHMGRMYRQGVSARPRSSRSHRDFSRREFDVSPSGVISEQQDHLQIDDFSTAFSTVNPMAESQPRPTPRASQHNTDASEKSEIAASRERDDAHTHLGFLGLKQPIPVAARDGYSNREKKVIETFLGGEKAKELLQRLPDMGGYVTTLQNLHDVSSKFDKNSVVQIGHIFKFDPKGIKGTYCLTYGDNLIAVVGIRAAAGDTKVQLIVDNLVINNNPTTNLPLTFLSSFLEYLNIPANELFDRYKK